MSLVISCLVFWDPWSRKLDMGHYLSLLVVVGCFVFFLTSYSLFLDTLCLFLSVTCCFWLLHVPCYWFHIVLRHNMSFVNSYSLLFDTSCLLLSVTLCFGSFLPFAIGFLLLLDTSCFLAISYSFFLDPLYLISLYLKSCFLSVTHWFRMLHELISYTFWSSVLSSNLSNLTLWGQDDLPEVMTGYCRRTEPPAVCKEEYPSQTTIWMTGSLCL